MEIRSVTGWKIIIRWRDSLRPNAQTCNKGREEEDGGQDRRLFEDGDEERPYRECDHAVEVSLVHINITNFHRHLNTILSDLSQASFKEGLWYTLWELIVVGSSRRGMFLC